MNMSHAFSKMGNTIINYGDDSAIILNS